MYPEDISTAHHIMDHHKSVQLKKTGDSTKESKGQNYEQEGFPTAHKPANVPGSEQDAGAPNGFRFKPGCFCFKCDREGHMTKECWFDAKEDKSPLNTTKEIDKKYQEKEQARRTFKKEQSIAGSTNFILSDVPTVEEYIDSDESKSQNIEFGISQSNRSSETLMLDIRQRQHVFNQETRCLNPYEVLFDSCPTCDIFVNSEFL